MAKKFTFDDAITTDIKGAASNSYIDNIKMIKIADIETNAENFYSLPDIEDLAEDIDRQGLIHSLAVAKISSEKYKLISGHRRLTAIKLLIENGKWNNETVPCYVITAKKSDAEMNLDLIDDYNKNLLEWQKAGGTSVKAKNNINHKGLHGELWKGELIDVVNGDVYSDICKLANENYYYAYIGENDVEKLKNSGICYHLQMSGDRIIAKVSIAYKPILDNIVNSNRSIKCDTGSTPKM